MSRAGREVIAILGAPDLWCSEHAAHVGRLLIETRIYLEWMAKQDTSVYEQYKEYGSGKAKLYARIFGESVATWLQPAQTITDAIEQLEQLSHNDKFLDHRAVDTRSNAMGGKSLRVLAEEAGLLDLYRTGYQLQSGVLHSEWWSLEMHSMERCLNVLHRGHLIPSMTLSAGHSEELATSWVNALYALMRISLSILGTEPAAVAAAFAWLDLEDDDEAGASEPA